MWGHTSQKASTPNCPPRHLHVVPLWKMSAWWTTEFSPAYANPTSLNKEEEGTDGERHRRWRWCLRKNTGRKATGNQLLTLPKNMASQIRNKINEEVLQMVQEERSLMDVIWRRKIGLVIYSEAKAF